LEPSEVREARIRSILGRGATDFSDAGAIKRRAAPIAITANAAARAIFHPRPSRPRGDATFGTLRLVSFHARIAALEADTVPLLEWR
jgi:hypothetical protein